MLKLLTKKKKKSTIGIMAQNTIVEDVPPTIPVAVPPPTEPSPVLFMPKPRYFVPPTKDILQNHDNDKTELEVPQEETEDVSPIMLPHRVRFTSSSSSTHGTPPLNNKPPASPTVNKRSSIAASSEDSHRVYESALESPISSSPRQVVQEEEQELNDRYTSLEDVEALQRQVQYIQQVCEQERQEWMKREHAHRLREKEMLEKISETQHQLRQALAQVQQQQQQQIQPAPQAPPPPPTLPQPAQQQQQKHYRVQHSCDDSGYMEYEEDEPDEMDDMSLYRHQHHHSNHHLPLPRARSMERPMSRQHRNKRWLRRRSVSVEKPNVISDENRIPHRSRSRASSYYDDEDERDAYFIDDEAEDELLDDDVEDWDDYYQSARAPPRSRVNDSTPTIRYLRPRRSYRRPPVQYHHPSSYYHHYYPYDIM